MTPGTLNLRAYRWTPFVYLIDIIGYDLTAATFAAQVRQYRDEAGSPLITLANASSSAEGISVSVATTEGVPTSTVQLRINETTLEGILPLSSSGRPSDDPDVPLVWDLHITTAALGKVRWLQGTFTLVAGATQ
jgi:hypothetical protein